MKLNGQVLKWSFLIIMASLCGVMLMSTYFFLTQRLPLDSYKSILELLGIPTLIGMIVQSFIHSNMDDKASEKAADAPSNALGSPTAASTAAMLILASLLMFPCLSWANSKPPVVNNTYVTNTTVNPTAIVIKEKNVFGPELKANRLVHLFGDWYLGAEGGKDVAYTDTSKGWFAYATVSYEGTLLDFSKKKEVAQ